MCVSSGSAAASTWSVLPTNISPLTFCAAPAPGYSSTYESPTRRPTARRRAARAGRERDRRSRLRPAGGRARARGRLPRARAPPPRRRRSRQAAEAEDYERQRELSLRRSEMTEAIARLDGGEDGSSSRHPPPGPTERPMSTAEYAYAEEFEGQPRAPEQAQASDYSADSVQLLPEGDRDRLASERGRRGAAGEADRAR